MITQEWTNEELTILYRCCQKYGCYAVGPILRNKHLVHKNERQVGNKFRQIFGPYLTEKIVSKPKIDVENSLNLLSVTHS